MVRSLNVKVWNTLTTIEYRFTLSSDGENGGNLQFYDEVSGTWVTHGSLTIGTTYSVSRALPNGWVAGNVITEQWRNVGGGGNPLEAGDVSYALIGECSDCDIVGNEFTGEAVSCGSDREVNFTFASEEGSNYFKMQGGLTNFTGDNAVISVTGGINLSIVQSIPGSSSNRRITLEGEIRECETITLNIKWTSTNSDPIITGNWSVKDADGLELAPEVAGLTCD